MTGTEKAGFREHSVCVCVCVRAQTHTHTHFDGGGSVLWAILWSYLIRDRTMHGC